MRPQIINHYLKPFAWEHDPGLFLLLGTLLKIKIMKRLYRKEDKLMKKNFIKKVLASVLALSLGVASLTGCGSTESKNQSESQST